MRLTCGANKGVNAAGVPPLDEFCGEPVVAGIITPDPSAAVYGLHVYTIFPLCADHRDSNIKLTLDQGNPELVKESGIIDMPSEVTDLG